MFNNILYFIIVLLIFSIYPADTPKSPLSQNLAMIFLTWLALAGYCRWAFLRFSRQDRGDGEQASKLAQRVDEYAGLI